MNIKIAELKDAHGDYRVDSIDGSFLVDSELVLSVTDGRIGYTVREVPAYQKSYLEEEDVDYSEYIGNPDQIIYVALADDKVAGLIVLKRNWNHFAYIEDIKVDKSCRRFGIGRKLIEQAVLWAKAGGMAGIMLETQSNNVNECKFYESCGFVIGGFDFFVYKGIPESSGETALYWYLHFDRERTNRHGKE
ncbi:GNAT family N-acetyltransferase [Brevibacillus borstelensis]|uniref:GNAT family N-acetyltransferase n=1 Tax=Brevibacillus borstelensis TaxID=45462 RepID=UPI00287F953D|nr:GNAT family N-acetyltransferase [Brevibacillus borstelensis]WNF05445.1 GNAT family N-acetyltransferase [Brevibacillus borstelensis]